MERGQGRWQSVVTGGQCCALSQNDPETDSSMQRGSRCLQHTLPQETGGKPGRAKRPPVLSRLQFRLSMISGGPSLTGVSEPDPVAPPGQQHEIGEAGKWRTTAPGGRSAYAATARRVQGPVLPRNPGHAFPWAEEVWPRGHSLWLPYFFPMWRTEPVVTPAVLRTPRGGCFPVVLSKRGRCRLVPRQLAAWACPWTQGAAQRSRGR